MQVAIFNKIEQISLRHEVVDMIREAIISGKLEPGTHLAENALASQMSVSRAPIREALRQLEQEGLIVSIPNKGSFVKDFDEKDIDEVFTLRATLENLAMELALGEGLQESDFDHLAQLINSQKEAVENEDFDRLTTLDVQFHEFIVAKANHKRLFKMWYALHAQCRTLLNRRFRAFPDYVPETVVPDHTAIMNALLTGDMQRISELNREINARVAKECKELLRREKL